MRYEVLVSDGTRFELERDEPLQEDGFFTQGDVSYMILEILPGRADFDYVLRVTHVGGPSENLPP